MKNRSIFNITVYSAIITATLLSSLSFASKPQTCGESISIEQALARAEKIVPANQRAAVNKKINEQALKGGLEITVTNLNTILTNALTQAPNNPAPVYVPASASAKTAAPNSLWSSAPSLGEAGKKVKESTENEIRQMLAGLSLKPTIGSAGAATTLPVPEALQGKVIYLRTANQGTNECGFHAVFNARIIQGLPSNQITGKALDAGKAAFKKQICQKEIYDDEIIKLANKEQVKNFYIVQYGSANTPLHIMQRSHNSTEDIDTILLELQNPAKSSRAYFAFNTGNHWVLAAAIKQAGMAKPTLYYINSLNSALTQKYGAYKFLVALAQVLEL